VSRLLLFRARRYLEAETFFERHAFMFLPSRRPGNGEAMQVSVTEAKGQLTELVRRAERGDEIILTRHGHAAVRLVPVKPVQDKKSRRALLEAVRVVAAAKATGGPSAARSQDFLYSDEGLPG
jgi:prevent-host-death family protein